MIFIRGHIQGFGRFRDFRFDLRDGLNVVFAPNEGGKSTLQHFLLGLLYGQLRSDLKTQRRLDPWVERYKPWRGPEFGGMLVCRTADDRELEIHRSFGRDETRIEICTSTGEDITKQYERQRNGDVLFAKLHFGMPKELYESLGIIRENRVLEIRSHDTIRDRLANLAQSGDEEVSIRRILDKLRGMLEAIGSERAPTKPYRQAKNLVLALQSERKALEDQRVRHREWLLEKNRMTDEVRILERELFKVRKLLWSARRQDVTARIASLEDLERDRDALRERVDSLEVQEDFPLESLEDLNQLVGARDSIVQRLNEVRSGKEQSLSQLERAASERRAFESYADLAGSAESEKITEWFVGYMSLSLQKEGLKKSADRLRAEVEVLEKRLADLAPDLRSPETDWDGFAREAAEDERTASAKCSALAEDAAKEKATLAEAVRTAFNRRLAGVLLIAVAAAPIAARRLVSFEGAAGWISYGWAAGCLLLSVWMWWAAAKIYRGGRAAEQRARALELERSEMQEAGESKRKELDAAVAHSGFRGLDAFLRAARKSEQDRAKLAEFRTQLEDVQAQSLRNQSQSDETFRSLKESLTRVGLSCFPGNLKSQVDLLRNNLRRFRELDMQYNRCIQKSDALGNEVAALEEECRRKNALIESLMEKAGVDTIEKFRQECAKRQEARELIEKEASRTREFDRLSEGRTIGQWKESLREIEAQAALQASAAPEAVKQSEEDSASEVPLLPYLPSPAELEEKERLIMSRLSDARQEHAHLVERVDQAFQNCRPSSEIDEDLAIAEMKLRELERNRTALGIAFDTIESLSRHQQEVLAPQLNAAVEQRFVRLCDGRYSEVRVDPDFNVRVREANTGELRLAELLSRGTQDQLYFAIRFGILDLVCNGSDPCPCLLDEPFAAYDRSRMKEAYGILEEEAARRQLILFTCREDLLNLALRAEANVLQLAPEA